MKSILSTLFTILALLITVGLGYYLYVQRGIEDVSNTGLEADISTEAALFLARLNEIQEIQLSSEVLSDARFTSLLTYSTPIQDEPLGRENPFEVIEE